MRSTRLAVAIPSHQCGPIAVRRIVQRIQPFSAHAFIRLDLGMPHIAEYLILIDDHLDSMYFWS